MRLELEHLFFFLGNLDNFVSDHVTLVPLSEYGTVRNEEINDMGLIFWDTTGFEISDIQIQLSKKSLEIS